MDNRNNNNFSNTIKFVDLDIEGELQKYNKEGYIEVKPEANAGGAFKKTSVNKSVEEPVIKEADKEEADVVSSEAEKTNIEGSVIEESVTVIEESDTVKEEGINKEDSDKDKTCIDIKRCALYFALFAASFIFWELVIRFQIDGKVQKHNLSFLLFVPAEAMFCTMLTGFTNNKIINKINTILLLILVAVYYVMQVIYLKNFGSLFSVSMVGMGTQALGNFWWALTDAIKACTLVITLIVLPIVLIGVVMIFRKKMCSGYSLPLHGIGLVLVVILWLFGILGLKMGGTDRQSAYYAFHNSYADTDSTSSKLGAMTTTLIEGGTYFFNIKSGDDTEALAATNSDALKMDFDDPAPVVSANSASQNSTSEPEVEVEPEPTFVVEPHVYDEIDFAALSEIATDSDTKALCEYFGSKEPTNTNQYTGMFEGYNLIYICGEGFSTLALDEDVTPTLYKMAHSGIILDNYYNSFLNTTTNGEYAFDTSLWPDVSRNASSGTAVGSFAQSCEKFMPMGLADLMIPEGINCYAYHNYYGHYYRRSYSWPNLGYENMKFLGEGMSFTSTWPASDLEMMEQSVDDYIENAPFHAYYMTFSGHGPYTSSNYMYNKNIAETKELLGDRADTLDYQAMGYLAGNLELEKAMVYLLDRLEEAGQLDNTVIVLTGDHTPYYLSKEGKNSIVGHEVDEDFEIYHSTCIIYNAGMEEPIETDTYCCNVDILPTMLNLFGIEYDSRLLMGTDIFSDGIHRARLYNGSFINERVMYNSRTGEAEWFIDTTNYSQAALDAYLNAMLEYTEGEYAASIKLLKSNFYFFVWKNSGLMTDDEAYAEVQRENMATNRAAEELQAEMEAAALAAEMEAQAALEAEQNGGQPAPQPQPQPEPEPQPQPAPQEEY